MYSAMLVPSARNAHTSFARRTASRRILIVWSSSVLDILIYPFLLSCRKCAHIAHYQGLTYGCQWRLSLQKNRCKNRARSRKVALTRFQDIWYNTDIKQNLVKWRTTPIVTV